MTTKKMIGVVVVQSGNEKTLDVLSISDEVVDFRVLHDGPQLITIHDFRPMAIEAVKQGKRQGEDLKTVDQFYNCFLKPAEIKVIHSNPNQVEIHLFPTEETKGAELLLILLNRPLGFFHPEQSGQEWLCLENAESQTCTDILITTMDEMDTSSTPQQEKTDYVDTDILLSMKEIPQKTQLVAMLKPEYHPQPIAGFFYRIDDETVQNLKRRCASMREIKPMLIWVDHVPLTFIAITIDECSCLVWLDYFKNDEMKIIFDYLARQEILFFSVVGDTVKHDIYAKNRYQKQFAGYVNVLAKSPPISPENYQRAQEKLLCKYSLNDLLDGKADRKKFLFKFFTRR